MRLFKAISPGRLLAADRVLGVGGGAEGECRRLNRVQISPSPKRGRRTTPLTMRARARCALRARVRAREGARHDGHIVTERECADSRIGL